MNAADIPILSIMLAIPAFPGLVHTARHIMKAGFARSAFANQ